MPKIRKSHIQTSTDQPYLGLHFHSDMKVVYGTDPDRLSTGM